MADILPLGDTDTVPGIRGVPNPDGGPGVRTLFFADYALDPISGNLYAVWQDARFGNFQYSSIAFSMSTDGGFTWSTPIRINQTPDSVPVGDRQAFIPSVAVAADGTVAMTYYDFRNNTSAPGLLTDYWMVHAHANTDLTNPANWASENRLTKSSFSADEHRTIARRLLRNPVPRQCDCHVVFAAVVQGRRDKGLASFIGRRRPAQH
jgi:hypothetical protein